jgi:hypothetical protein
MKCVKVEGAQLAGVEDEAPQVAGHHPYLRQFSRPDRRRIESARHSLQLLGIADQSVLWCVFHTGDQPGDRGVVVQTTIRAGA